MTSKILTVITVLSLFVPHELLAQKIDSVEVVSMSLMEFYKKENPGLKYSFDNEKQIHNYSGNWDFDGDKKLDSLWFVANDAAHVYFYLKVRLSARNEDEFFDYIADDIPILCTVDFLQKQAKEEVIFPMFVVHDFNKDGVVDLYITNNGFSEIPAALRAKGITTQRIVLNFHGKAVRFQDLKSYKLFR